MSSQHAVAEWSQFIFLPVFSSF